MKYFRSRIDSREKKLPSLVFTDIPPHDFKSLATRDGDEDTDSPTSSPTGKPTDEPTDEPTAEPTSSSSSRDP